MGLTEPQFIKALRTGHDIQNAHPNCAPVGTGTSPTCAAAPEDGSKLQVMPWPALAGLTDSDIDAIYQYLSSIPCISDAGFSSTYPWLVHTCPATNAFPYHTYSYAKGKLIQTD